MFLVGFMFKLLNCYHPVTKHVNGKKFIAAKIMELNLGFAASHVCLPEGSWIELFV
jgi:hypothetical protein